MGAKTSISDYLDFTVTFGSRLIRIDESASDDRALACNSKEDRTIVESVPRKGLGQSGSGVDSEPWQRKAETNQDGSEVLRKQRSLIQRTGDHLLYCGSWQFTHEEDYWSRQSKTVSTVSLPCFAQNRDFFADRCSRLCQ